MSWCPAVSPAKGSPLPGQAVRKLSGCPLRTAAPAMASIAGADCAIAGRRATPPTGGYPPGGGLASCWAAC